jgi:integrase
VGTGISHSGGLLRVSGHAPLRLRVGVPAPNGGFPRYDNFRSRFWAPAVTAAGVSSSDSSFTLHQLRHTAAAFMIDDGGDPLHVMRRMGHSDIRTTYNLYGHKFPDREDELVARLDARFDRMGGVRGIHSGIRA